MTLFIPNKSDPESVRKFLEETLDQLRAQPGSATVDANIGHVQDLLSRVDEFESVSELISQFSSFISGLVVPDNSETEVKKGHIGFVTPGDEETIVKPKRRKIGFI